MAQGGTTKAQLEQVQKELNDEAARWDAAGLPFIGTVYRLNDNEFMHHVHVLALTRLMKEHLGITQDQADLMIKKVFLEEMKSMFDLVQDFKRQAARQAIIDGIHLVKPPEPEI